jgi:hypothetical protein
METIMATLGTAMPADLLRNDGEVERASIRSLNVLMKAVAEVIHAPSICTDIS